jgi:hypothetical protein
MIVTMHGMSNIKRERCLRQDGGGKEKRLKQETEEDPPRPKAVV